MGQLATKTNNKDWLMYNDYKVESKVLYIVNSLLFINFTRSVVLLLLNPLKIMFEIPILVRTGECHVFLARLMKI